VNVKVNIVVAVALVVAVSACSGRPVWRVAGIAGTGNQIAVSCYQADASGRRVGGTRVFVLSASRARSVHGGDVCPS
jgi:hypothetical protein